MNRILARLFPRYFRRTIKLDMSVRDWREFEGMLLKSKGKIKVGDTLNLVDENTGTVVTFRICDGKTSST
jgi:hypothetical protein